MWDEITIEPNRWKDNQFTDPWSVYAHGTYDEHSVLAGQPRRVFLDSFKTIEEAKAKYPNAATHNHPTTPPPLVLPEVAPDWFDPLDAGEEW